LGLNEAVIFTGIVPQEDMVGLINAATVIVYPSYHEGLGLVALEALACGKPIVVNLGGALHEVVGEAGLVIQDSNDVTKWASALESVCCDDQLRQRLSQQALARAADFAPDLAARRIFRLYQQVMNEG
jgi:glycosyltransferase involved in cell wall biosynthesis